MSDKAIGIIALILFGFIGWLFVFTVGGFAVNIFGIAGSLVVLTAFYLSTETVGWLKDGPCLAIMRFLVKRRDNSARELGALIAVLTMWVLVSIPVSLSIWGWASVAPGAFLNENASAAMLSEAFRLGFAVVMLFGFMWLFNYPVRVSSVVKQFFLRHRDGKVLRLK